MFLAGGCSFRWWFCLLCMVVVVVRLLSLLFVTIVDGGCGYFIRWL